MCHNTFLWHVSCSQSYRITDKAEQPESSTSKSLRHPYLNAGIWSPWKTALFDLTRKIEKKKAKAGACLLYCSMSDLLKRRCFYHRHLCLNTSHPRHFFKLHFVGNDFFKQFSRWHLWNSFSPHAYGSNVHCKIIWSQWSNTKDVISLVVDVFSIILFQSFMFRKCADT